MSRRPLLTANRAVAGLVLLAALVVGGLVWVTVSALRVERAERLAADRAEQTTRERLALWRLDSHMLAPLGVENNRPFNNYSTLAPPALVVLDEFGLPKPDPGRVPSPLLSADLPAWMLLHVQLDPADGWSSPLVPDPDLAARLEGEPLGLPLLNCTADRGVLLDRLRKTLPADRTRLALADQERNDPDTAPYVVPLTVPLCDEPATGKPGPAPLVASDRPDTAAYERPASGDGRAEADEMYKKRAWADADRESKAELEQAAKKLGEAKGDGGADKQKKDDVAKREIDDKLPAIPAELGKLNSPPAFNINPQPPAPMPTTPLNPSNNALNLKQNDGDKAQEQRARKEPLDQLYAGRRGAYDTQLGGGRGGSVQPNAAGGQGGFGGGNPGGPGGGVGAPGAGSGSPGGGGGPGVGGPGLPGPDTKSKTPQGDTKKNANPPGGGSGSGSPPPGQPAPTTSPNPPADSPTQQQAATDPAKALEDQFRNTQEWSEKWTRLVQDRSRFMPEKNVKELNAKDQNQNLGAKPKDAQSKDGPPAKTDGKLADGMKGSKADPKETTTSRGSAWAAAKPGDCPDDAGVVAAEAKAPPVVAPVAVRLGPLRPRWLTAADGTEYLLLVRAATSDQQVVYQGVVVDWPALRATLTNLVADLFPHAALVVLREDDDAPAERTMTTLPVRLDTGADGECPDCGWTPLRFGLVIAWAAALLAIAATAIGGRAVLAMSDRRVRFASAVTHELRTPLTALQLHLDLLTSGFVTDEAKKAEYLNTLSAEVDRLNRLVENVLDFARLEKQSAATAARPVPVADVLDTLHRTWADRLRSEGFEFVTETSDVPPAVLADPRVLEQVLGNLIDNARKYAKGADDRRITVRAEAAGPRVAFAVEDHGPGVPAGERRAIFKPFTRGSGAIDTGGAGLGLSLAREWAELFGGSLTYHPHPAGGACFRLELPAA